MYKHYGLNFCLILEELVKLHIEIIYKIWNKDWREIWDSSFMFNQFQQQITDEAQWYHYSSVCLLNVSMSKVSKVHRFLNVPV